MRKILDYIPGAAAFVAVWMGVSTAPKWDSTQLGLHHLTVFGWETIGLGLAALAGSVSLTWIRQREIDGKVRQRKRLREIAHVEARLALRRITGVFFTLFDDNLDENCESQLAPPHVQDSDRLISVMRTEVRSKSPFFPSGSWAEILKESADRGAERMDRAMQIYSTYFEPDVLEALSNLRTSEFLFRLQRLDEHVQVNAQVTFLEFPFPANIGDERDYGFNEFWNLVRKLDALLEGREDVHRRI